MLCHNGSNVDDYAGPGIENPHPFGVAANLTCSECHGGNPGGTDKASSHVPAPPEIGDRDNWTRNRKAYFNRLTLTGIDKFPDYEVDGVTYTAIDYLQFINPGDLRVVSQNRSCGKCHQAHVDVVTKSPLATEVGILSGALFSAGIENAVPENRGRDQDTAGDHAFRAVVDPDYNGDTAGVGEVGRLFEFPVFSRRDDPAGIDENREDYRADVLFQGLDAATNRAIAGSPLANVLHEQFAFTCGDCHLGSAGANNRYGDFRSSGCSACHMPKSVSGRSLSGDPNVDPFEPRDVDDIDDPELPHLRRHRIMSVAKTLANGTVVEGITDYSCAGCHQGSNRTVMQYWGIRLDQNQDLRRRVQYPSNPFDWKGTHNDTRLFDPVLRNRTFNGRNANQYILFEDYDDDDKDDTPPDVHYEAGMGCIDCHGSADLHGGVPGENSKIVSHQEQAVAIQCESCHGTSDEYANTVQGTRYDGTTATLAVDSKGRPLRHVVLEEDGHFYLYSRLTGKKHFVIQTKDTVVPNTKVNPLDPTRPLYSRKASYAMGRDDGDDLGTGLGPQQSGPPTGFRHADNMDCASCHAAWTNTCMGCHLEGEFNRGNNFSNITGDQIVFRERNADFVYQSPIFMQLGVNARNKITQVSSNTKMFFKYRDDQGNFSNVFAFADRAGRGFKPGALGALGHNALAAHSIRGKVTETNEGPRYCVACHLTSEGLAQYGETYESFRTAMRTEQFDQLNFEDLKLHFGQNTGNRLNSPLWIHMVAGLGTGLFLFDENGCPINPLDNDDNRKGCVRAPADDFSIETVIERAKFNLDRIVDEDGNALASNAHPLLLPGLVPIIRDDASANPLMAGPLPSRIIRRLTDPETGIVLDTYMDADGNAIGPQKHVITGEEPPPEE